MTDQETTASLRLALAASRDEANEQRKLANAALQDLESSRDEAEKAKADHAEIMVDVEKTYRELAAKLDSLRADKERLDWLNYNSEVYSANDRITRIRFEVPVAMSLRAAIDAARADAARKEQP